MKFFTRFCPSESRSDFVPEGKSLTQQQFLQQSDVNWIIQHYQEIPQTALGSVNGPRMPMFGDFTSVPDLQTAYRSLSAAEASFMALPADLRLRFNNDPLQLLAFVQDSSNREEAIKLGLIEKGAPAPSVVGDAPSTAAVNQETAAQAQA